jgi:CheY-like chemotaxis protein
MMDREIHVLYVEDDAKSRQVMELLLQSRMKLENVTLFDDSQNFIERIAALNPRPDVVLLDIHVEPLDGFEMLEILRRTPWAEGIPIVAVTASVMNEEVDRLRVAGFDSCLSKPLNLATFPDTFQKILDGKSVWNILN